MLRYTDKQLKIKDKFYENKPGIRFKGYKKSHDKKSIKELANRLFVNREATYTIDGKKDCSRNRSRSFIAFILLCKGYNKKVTSKELYEFIKQNDKHRNFGLCGTIHRSVFGNGYVSIGRSRKFTKSFKRVKYE